MIDRPVTLARLQAALNIVAQRLVANPGYTEIFERIEAEIALAEALTDPSPVARARRTIEARRRIDLFIGKESA